MGADTNPGTQSQPWKTIQRAADTMAAGDTVMVLAGSYASERVQVTVSGSAEAPITYQVSGAVTMKGFHIQANYITISGFQIANTDYKRWDEEVSAGIYVSGSNNVIENNYIHDSAIDGIYIFGPPSNPTASSNNIIRNNRLYHNELAGIEVNGRSNLIEGNEVWGTVQCHPTLTAVEDVASDNPKHLSCPEYPASVPSDADGMRFFGQGHTFRKNYIHDILYGPPGINPSIGDFNGNPHIDGFQTWVDSKHELAQNIIFDQNWIDNAQYQSSAENGTGWMVDSTGSNTRISNLTFQNNFVRANHGIYLIGVDSAVIVNNIVMNDMTLSINYHEGIRLANSPNGTIKNNILYDMDYHCIVLEDVPSKTAITGNNLEYRSDGKPLKIDNNVYDSVRRSNDWWDFNPYVVYPYNVRFLQQTINLLKMRAFHSPPL